MERLTIDEAIKHAKETAEWKRESAIGIWRKKLNNPNFPWGRDFTREEVERKEKECIQCAEEHEQLAEWLEKLKEYEQAEEDGLLIKLPCRVGDKLYGLYCYNREWKIRELTVSDFIIRAYRIQRVEIYFEETGLMFETCLFDGTLNENLFLSKAEAEQALAKMKGE